MFVGAAGRDGMAMALTWTSDDLSGWAYDGVALQRSTSVREPVWMGALWECPQVFDLDGAAVMVSSIWDDDVLHYAAYAVGSFADGRFIADRWDRLTWGDSLYAPSLFTDADGQLALSFWLRGIRGDDWAGAHSIPFRLNVVEGRLVASPHPDVAAHRGAASPDGAVSGLAADIDWSAGDGPLTISSGSAAAASVEHEDGWVVVTTPEATSRFPGSDRLRIIVDGPVLEVCSDAGVFAAAIAPHGTALQISTSGGETTVYELTRGRIGDTTPHPAAERQNGE